MNVSTPTGHKRGMSGMLRMNGSVGWLARFVVLVVALGLVSGVVASLGCAADSGERGEGPLWADPGIVRLSPARARVHVEIHNRSGTARPVGKFTLTGDDWDALRFVDDTLPRTIPGYDSVELELELSPVHFREQPGLYRSGLASLNFSSDHFNYAVPIEFVGSDVDRSNLDTTLVGALALAALGLAIAWGPLRARPTSQPPSESGTLGLRFAVAGAFASLLLVAATIPIGLGICRGRLLELVGPRELEQCREALGGAELLALPGSPGIWWWLVALALATATLTIVRATLAGHPPSAHGPALALALAGLRLLGFTLLLVALVCGLTPASASATDLVLAQAKFVKLGGLDIPRWGIVAQPLGCALGFVLVALATPTRRAPHPIIAALERLESLVWAALLVTLYLGGPTIPALSQRPLPLLAHAPQLILELLVFALEIAAVLFLAARLHTHVTGPKGLALTDTHLLERHAHWTIPLAFLNLLGVLIWRTL